MFGRGRYFGLRGQALNLAVAILAGLDFLLFGYDQGVMGGLLTLQSFVRYFPEIDLVNIPQNISSPGGAVSANPVYQYRSTIQGISVGSYNVGCFLGAILTIFISDRLGRRRVIFGGCLIMTVGAILQCSAFSLPQFIVGRIITGIGNGMNTSTVPTWQSETTKSHERGKMVMIEGAMITGGICLSYWLDFGFSFLEPSSVAWRFPVGFQIFFALVILVGIMELPESPRWLILKGKDEEAISVLCALSDLPPEDRFIKSEFLAIKDTVMEASNYGYRDLFVMGKDRGFHRVLLGYINQVFQQISGINLITYYAATIYEQQIGLTGFVSRILAAANGTEYFAASWIAVFTIERFGRRSLMLFGAVGMSLSMVVLAISTSFQRTSAGIVAAVFLFVFNTFFAIGWLGMTWLYPAEIVPLRIRAPANALSTSANWIFNFMVVMITPVAFSTIQYRTYIIFAVINAFIVPVVYFFYPETAYRSLEEMDAIFSKTKGWFNVVSTAKHEPRRYDDHGNLLVQYAGERGSEQDTDGAAPTAGGKKRTMAAEEKPGVMALENVGS